MERLNQVRQHNGNNPVLGGNGRDDFDFTIPNDEAFDHVDLDISASHRGGARIADRPLPLDSGNRRISVSWWFDGGSPWTGNGKIEYRVRAQTVAMNAPTRRVLGLVRGITDGECGLYLRRIGGPVLVGFNESKRFEPASSIKALHLYHAFSEIEAGHDSLNEDVTIPGSDFCSTSDDDEAYTRATLQECLSRMMRNSDNSCAEAVRRRFGKLALRNTAQALGMADTVLVHSLGCGWRPEFGGHNWTTLVDLGRLYEKVATGNPFPNNAANFTNTIQNWVFDEWKGIVDEEAASLEAAAPGRLTAAEIQAFKGGMTNIFKPGGYGGPDVDANGRPINATYNSLAGMLTLPARGAGGTAEVRRFCHGVWVQNGSNANDVGTARVMATKEIVREEIRSALATFQ